MELEIFAAVRIDIVALSTTRGCIYMYFTDTYMDTRDHVLCKVKVGQKSHETRTYVLW